ncbi:odorant receptor 85c-like [Megalopta genalis]|uniref:odorant receptor 85c-like n=1 Tax=Megalopta genalis TaxID=115081 RepID=UPI003FD19614
MKPREVPDPAIAKPRNPYYEEDVAYIFKPSRWILKSIGIWPLFTKGSNQFFEKVSVVLSIMILTCSMVPFTMYITLEEKNIMVILRRIGPLSYGWVSLLKYCSLIACKPTLKHCMQMVQDDWKEVERKEDRELMLKYGNVGRNLTLLCVVLMYSGGLMYRTIVQFASGTHIDERNRTIKPLSYPAYSGFFDPQKRPYYDLLYTLHFMCGYIMNSVSISVCGLAALFATHICGQIDIMILKLQNLADHRKKTDSNPRLAKIIEHHVRTLRFSSMIETLLQEICFLEFIASTFIICMLEYYTLTDWKDNNTVGLIAYIVLLFSFMFNMFILCYIGELLVEKTGNVGLLCFTIDWYNLPVETMRSLILIIGISKYPSKISAGQIVDLNLSTFGSVIKSSLAYLSFLRTSIA